MRIGVVAAILVTLSLVYPERSRGAHHSFSAEFDSTRQVTLAGEVVMMEWVNPHSWLHIDVKKPDGRKMDLGGSGSATQDPRK